MLCRCGKNDARRALLIKAVLILLFSKPLVGWTDHPGGNEQGGMVHPAQALPADASLPEVTAQLSRDMMDGFNLEIRMNNFNVTVPKLAVPDYVFEDAKKVMQGHIHLYINGIKVMRLYGLTAHIPTKLLKPGLNSLTVSINNKMHGPFTYNGQQIQSTIIFTTEGTHSNFVKNRYSWPKLNAKFNSTIPKGSSQKVS